LTKKKEEQEMKERKKDEAKSMIGFKKVKLALH